MVLPKHQPSSLLSWWVWSGGPGRLAHPLGAGLLSPWCLLTAPPHGEEAAVPGSGARAGSTASSPWDVPPVHFLEIGSKITSWEQSGCPGEAKECGGWEATCRPCFRPPRPVPGSPGPHTYPVPRCPGTSCISTIRVQKRAVKSLLTLAGWAGGWGLSGMGTQVWGPERRWAASTVASRQVTQEPY